MLAPVPMWARGTRLRARAAGTLVAGMLALALAWTLAVATALAASPAPSSGAGADPRSSGQGPGLVGDPLLAILVVAAIGVLSLVLTLAYVRASGGSQGADDTRQ